MVIDAQRWLSRRIRMFCVLAFAVGALLPPYVPKYAYALGAEEGIDVPQVLLVEEGFLMKSSSLTQQGARLAYTNSLVHTVHEGESLEKLAQRYDIAVDTIRWANKLEPGISIQPGQELVILPVNGILHTVGRGQTLSRIAELYGVPSEEITRQNKLEGDFILAGQELIIPGGKPIVGKPQQIAKIIPGEKPKPTAQVQEIKPAPNVAATPSIGVLQMPCNNCLYTQYYRAGHYAVDLQTKGGGPIFAAEAGTVIRAETGWNGGYGNVIEIDHGNGLVTLYGHNKELYVKEGDEVARGQVIAWMGNTGLVHGPTGIHLHFEVRVDGVKRNPMLYLQ